MKIQKFLFLALSVAVLVDARTIYVSADGVPFSSVEDHDSWANATSGFQSAIDSASFGDQVWVKAGIYYVEHPYTPSIHYEYGLDRTFAPKNGVHVYGGFAGTESALSQRDWDAHPTILSGDINRNDYDSLGNLHDANLDGITDSLSGNAAHVLSFESNITDTTIWDGFWVTGGNGGTEYAGGIYVTGGRPLLRHMRVFGNVGGDFGGGVFLGSAHAVLMDSRIYGNRASTNGGGIYGTIGLVLQTMIYNNYAPYGGGVYFSSASGDAPFSVVHSTLAANQAYLGAGAYGTYKGRLVNSVAWGNVSSGDAVHSQVYSYGTYFYMDRVALQNDSLGFWALRLDSLNDGLDSLACYPRFSSYTDFVGLPTTQEQVDTLSKVLWKTRATGCMVDQGNPAVTEAQFPLDFDGNRRWQGYRPDIGPLEAGDSSWTPSVYPDGRIYVVRDTLPDGDGSSWQTAFRDFRKALRAAELSGVSEIWVGRGTYVNNPYGDRRVPWTSHSAIRIVGGFAGTETDTAQRIRADLDLDGTIEPWEFADSTVFSGGVDIVADKWSKNSSTQQWTITGMDSNATQILQLFDESGASLLEGVTIRDGNYTGSVQPVGGVVTMRSGEVRNVTFRRNIGPALYAAGTTRIMDSYFHENSLGLAMVGYSQSMRCLFYGNSGTAATLADSARMDSAQILGNSGLSGGGLSLAGGRVQHSLIQGNSAYNYGGGAYLSGGVVFNCRILNNRTLQASAGSGGGVYMAKGAVAQSVVSNNYSNIGGGIQAAEGRIIQSAIVRNSARTDTSGSGLSIASGTVEIYNSVVWGNRGRQYYRYPTGLTRLRTCATGFQDSVPTVLVTSICATPSFVLDSINTDTLRGPWFRSPSTVKGTTTDNNLKSLDYRPQWRSILLDRSNDTAIFQNNLVDSLSGRNVRDEILVDFRGQTRRLPAHGVVLDSVADVGPYELYPMIAGGDWLVAGRTQVLRVSLDSLKVNDHYLADSLGMSVVDLRVLPNAWAKKVGDSVEVDVASADSVYVHFSYVIAADGYTDTALVTVTVEGNHAPALTGPDTVSVAEASELHNALTTLHATDPDGDALQWSLAGRDAGVFLLADSVLSIGSAYSWPLAAETLLVEVVVSDGEFADTLAIAVYVAGDAVVEIREPGAIRPRIGPWWNQLRFDLLGRRRD